MSKNPRRVTLGALPSGQRSLQPWAKDARPDAAIHRELLQQVAEGRFATLPREIALYLDGVATSCVKVYWPKSSRPRATLNRKEIASLIRRAVHEGYLTALMDYAVDIQQSEDASSLYIKREQGGKKGRASQIAAKLSRAPQAQAMLSEGSDVPEIAKRLGCSISTVYRALSTAAAPQARSASRRRIR